MRKVFTLCLTGVGFGLVLGCGAGKDPEKRPGIRFDEGGSAGTDGGPGPAVAGAGGYAGSAGTAGASAGASAAGANTAGAPPEGGSAGDGTGSLPVGEDCAGDGECGVAGICYQGPGSSRRTCRASCDGEDAGTQGTCGADELCVTTSDGTRAACLRSCDPDAGSDSCAEGDFCLSEPQPTFTGGTSVAGLCVTGGTPIGGDGEPCDAGTCQPGLVCYQGALPTVGVPHCTLPCDPRAASGDPGSCGEGAVCRRMTETSGACLTICDPYSTESCPTGTWCFPFHEQLSDGTTLIEGHCVSPGTLEDGEPCTAGSCEDGLLCVEPNTAYSLDGPRCRPVCALGDSDSCDVGVCALVAGTALELAACQPTCDLLDEGPDAGCEDGQWCAPTATSGANVCVAPGSGVAGEACQSSEDCSSGTYCDCRFGSDSDCSGDGRCEVVCDPRQGDACAEGTTCVPEVREGIVMPFGVCREICDYGGDVNCSDGEETCVPGQFVGASADACLDLPGGVEPGQPCGHPDVELNEPCQSSALCVISERTREAECIDVCRPDVAPFETTEHPDCADPLATCRQISVDGAYGYCR